MFFLKCLVNLSILFFINDEYIVSLFLCGYLCRVKVVRHLVHTVV